MPSWLPWRSSSGMYIAMFADRPLYRLGSSVQPLRKSGVTSSTLFVDISYCYYAFGMIPIYGQLKS